MSHSAKKRTSVSSRTASRTAGKSGRPQASGRGRLPGILQLFLLCLLAAGVNWFFWAPLWNGGGLIGGDLYPYYFPQKSYLADQLHQGHIPLWNSLVGFGYPVLGESQTAALYPPNLLLYSVFSINAAYNISQILHYLLAFAGTYVLARRWRVGMAGSLLAATIFVYGWFPARICLEWAIIGGAWFVWILWGATRFLQTGEQRILLLTAVFLGLDLLAGHYNLAFITLLALIPLPWLVPGGEQTESTGMGAAGVSHDSTESSVSAVASTGTNWDRIGWMWGAVFVGFLLAAVQLLPSWELKSLSQRRTVSEVFLPGYGHLPLQAISQLWMPWSWYAGEKSFDEQLGACRFWAVPAATNQAEAQLYLGMLTLALLLGGLLIPALRRESPLRRPWGWLTVAALSLVLATGWPVYFFPMVPGLNFFRGAGRYSMVAALVLSMLAGSGLQAVLRWRNWGPMAAGTVVGVVIAVTVIDLWAASRQYQFGAAPYIGRQVFYATLVDGPPIQFRDESSLRQFFREAGDECRLYAPGQNIPTILGVSSLPVYLGLGPEFYESDQLKMNFAATDPQEIEEIQNRLRRFGVTHLLLESPLEPRHWAVEFIGPVMDALLNRALGRQQPYYFYALNNALGRVSVEPLDVPGSKSPSAIRNRIRSVLIAADRVRIEVESDSDCRVILRDLFYPGWELQDSRQKSFQFDEHFRATELKQADAKDGVQIVEWVYRPGSVFWGGFLSLMSLMILVAGWIWGDRDLRSVKSRAPQSEQVKEPAVG